MLPPLPRRSGWAYCFAHFTQPCQPSPKGSSGRPAHCPFRGLLGVHSRCGLHTRAVTNLRHANRRLQALRYLHDGSDCFRLERLPGGTCAHWKAPPLHGAHPSRTLGLTGFVASLRTISHSPFGLKVLVLAVAQGMFSAVSNATTRVHLSSRGRGSVLAARGTGAAVIKDEAHRDSCPGDQNRRHGCKWP